jgi:hypothetical protein
MCLKCTHAHLEQLRWELLIQEHELQGIKPSPEIIDTVKDRIKESGGKAMLPRIKLQRTDDMNDQQYGEAVYLFKEGMLQRRRMEIMAIDIVQNLLTSEVFQPYQVLTVPANVVLNGDDDETDSIGDSP